MDAERIRGFLLGLPHVVETVQWGNNLVLWVGDKAIGGRMFTVVNLDGDGKAVISYPVGRESYGEMLEIDGVIPAPYMARIFWVAVERWDVFRAAEWERKLRAAHEITFAKMPPRTRAILAMPLKEQRKRIRERKALLKARSAAKR